MTGKTKNIVRCNWCKGDELYQKYHDEEWGVPSYDDETLFEFLILEGAQAGLSWITILKKRENYRKAYNDFNPEKMARYSEKKIERLIQNEGIIRNELKIRSAITNAKCYLELCEQEGSLSSYLWNYVDGKPIQNQWKTLEEVPASTELSDTISKDMKKRGFKFFGTTICYAFMQAVGMVNDHTTDCFRYKKCKQLAKNK